MGHSRPRWGSWLLLAALVGLLMVAIAVLYVGWDPQESGAMTGAGYAAMALGIVATLALGIGLMALMLQQPQRTRLRSAATSPPPP